MARRKGSSDLSIYDMVEAPRSDVSTESKSVRRAKIWRVWVWIAVVMAPVSLLGWMSSVIAPDPEPPAAPVGQSSPGRTAGTATVRAWLDSEPAPVPGAVLISWDGADPLDERVVEDSINGDYTVSSEINRFTIGVPVPVEKTVVDDADDDAPVDPADEEETPSETTVPSDSDSAEPNANVGDGSTLKVWSAIYSVAVIVEIDSRGGALTVSEPSVIPKAMPSEDNWQSLNVSWPGYTSTADSEPVTVAVSRWADAYISADPEDLRLATGDPVAENTYVTFLGPDSIEAEVIEVASNDGGATAIARVRLSPHWPGQPVVEADQEAIVDVPVAPPFDLDVLILNADTGSPVVVAWGGPGEGPSLEPFGNASVGKRTPPSVTVPATTSTTKPAATTTTAAPKPPKKKPAKTPEGGD